MTWLLALFGTAAGRILIAAVAIVAVVGVSWAGFGTHYYNKGWRAALAAIAAQNIRAIKESEDVRKEVIECFANSGDWDIYDARCLRRK